MWHCLFIRNGVDQMTYLETRAAVSRALEEPGVEHVNSDAFFAACDKWDIEPGDLEDALFECGVQEAEDRRHFD